MAIRNAKAEWKGDLFSGSGSLSVGSGSYTGPYSFKSRIEDGAGTNPEELIGAAHAGCYSMALSFLLGNAGHVPESVRTQAHVHFDKVGEEFLITRIDLETEAVVPGMDRATFQEIAAKAKVGCTVSRALSAVDITLSAKLV